MKPTISLIICTHNNAKDLPKAIDSVCKQDFKLPFELIVINDDSTDNTKEIVENFQKEYPFIRYFEVKNHSLPMNRIFGVKHAEGEYIMFLDGDDWIAPNMMTKMYDAMISSDADLVNCGMYFVRDKKTSKSKLVSDNLLNQEEAFKELFKDYKFRSYMHTKLFKKELFLKIDFIDKVDVRNIMYEDLLFCFFYLVNVKKVKCIKDCLHFYNKTNSGAMTKTGYNRSQDSMKVRATIRAMIEKINNKNVRKSFIQSKSRASGLLFVDYLLSKFPDSKTKKEVRRLTKADFKNIYSKKFDIDKINYKDLIY